MNYIPMIKFLNLTNENADAPRLDRGVHERTEISGSRGQAVGRRCFGKSRTKNSIIEYILLIILTCLTWTANAEEVFPARCKPLVVLGDLVSVPATKSTVTMIHNLSNTDLWVTHPVSDPGASAGWSSHLQAGRWSALVLNDEKFELSCIESRPGHEQQVSCSTVLAVCQWPATVLPQKASGTWWAAEDMLLSPLIAYIKRHGFVLAASAKDE